MKLLRHFFAIVPKAVQFWAVVTIACTVLIGLVTAYKTAHAGAVLRTMSTYGSAALVFGIVLAVWLLSLGFVFADARQRAMRPILWVLVAALFPHLLGLLLYFVLRHPIAVTCTGCGMTISNYQRFCSWCGSSQIPPVSIPPVSIPPVSTTPDATHSPLTTNPSQGASQ